MDEELSVTPGVVRALETTSPLFTAERRGQGQPNEGGSAALARARTAKVAAELNANRIVRVRRPSMETDDGGLSPDLRTTPTQSEVMGPDVMRAQLAWLDARFGLPPLLGAEIEPATRTPAWPR